MKRRRTMDRVREHFAVPADHGAVVRLQGELHIVTGTPFDGSLKLWIRPVAGGRRRLVHPAFDLSWPSIAAGQPERGYEE